MQPKKGKGQPASSVNLIDTLIEEHIRRDASTRTHDDRDQERLWAEVSATTELIALFLKHTSEWEALEVGHCMP